MHNMTRNLILRTLLAMGSRTSIHAQVVAAPTLINY